jgi:hypothetical protein
VISSREGILDPSQSYGTHIPSKTLCCENVFGEYDRLSLTSKENAGWMYCYGLICVECLVRAIGQQTRSVGGKAAEQAFQNLLILSFLETEFRGI